jgi:YVTN family beta-propeller protein
VISGATNKVVATVPVGGFPGTPTYDSGNGDLYEANFAANNVSVISGVTSTVVASVPVGTTPLTPAYDSANGELYVPDYFGDDVSVIEGGATVVFTETGLATGMSWSVVFDGILIPSTTTTINVTVLAGNHTFQLAPVANYTVTPSGGIVDVRASSYLVLVTFTSTVAPTCNVTIEETGLPSDTNWSAVFGGTEESTSGSALTFAVSEGTYGYQLLPVSGYTVSPSSGTAIVAGSYLIAVAYSSSTPTTQVSVVGYSEAFTVAIAMAAVALGFGVAAIVLGRRPRPPSERSP